MTQMKKTLQVVMLPTNEKAKICLDYKKLTLYQTTLINCTQSWQHLYFLSDEEIKKGDWYYDFHNQEVCQSNFTHLPLEFGDCKKIIATTDKSLMYLESDYSCYLPQPSQSFIEHFVEEYNKGNVITEVEVEYENTIAMDGHTVIGVELKINSDNTINILPKKDSWSREEVIEKIKKFTKDNTVGFIVWVEDFDSWFEKNL